MPRRTWLDAPGTLHHVFVRGIEKRQAGRGIQLGHIKILKRVRQ